MDDWLIYLAGIWTGLVLSWMVYALPLRIKGWLRQAKARRRA